MSTLYIDARLGLSSDMLAAGLFGFVDDKTTTLHNIGVNLPKNYTLSLDSRFSYDREGLGFTIKNLEYTKGIGEKTMCQSAHGYSFQSVLDTISATMFNPKVKQDAISIYNKIAYAEMKVHNADISTLHLHEVGSKRAIFNVLSCCYLMDLLKIDKVISSPINVGFGTVICAHGEVSVPAPATKILIEKLPTFSNDIKGELLTPTGASLLGHFVTEFRDFSNVENAQKSIGIGTRDIGRAGGVTLYFLK